MMLTLVALFLQFPVLPGNWNLKAASFPEIIANSAASPSAPAAVAPSVPGLLSGETALSHFNLPPRDFRAAAVPLFRRDLNDSPARAPHNKWLALMFAEHSAATFDAWSTRQAISTGQYREANPLLRPFAGNASIYVAIQAVPLAFDYFSRRMMASHRPWLKRTWWLPQTLSTMVSVGSGAYNVAH
jgi:hypothetical protein